MGRSSAFSLNIEENDPDLLKDFSHRELVSVELSILEFFCLCWYSGGKTNNHSHATLSDIWETQTGETSNDVKVLLGIAVPEGKVI